MAEHPLKLVVVRSAVATRPEYPLVNTVVSIGRSHRNAIVLQDTKVSRFHAEIVRTEREYVLRDLESANGVKVNGARCTERPIAAQDTVVIGDTEFRVEKLAAHEAVLGAPVDPPTPVVGGEPPPRPAPALRIAGSDEPHYRNSLVSTVDPLARSEPRPDVAVNETQVVGQRVERLPAPAPLEAPRADAPGAAAPRLLEPMRHPARPELSGHDALVSWLGRRALAFEPAGLNLHLAEPSAIALVGATGTGKSTAARYTAVRWNLPLFRLNLPYLVMEPADKWTSALAAALAAAGAGGNAVLVIEDVDRAADRFERMGGDVRTAWRLAAELLAHWVHTKPPVPFTVLTARDPGACPTLFEKGGSLDEVWHLDLPNPRERVSAVEQALRARGRPAEGLDAKVLGEATDGFTVAEVLEGVHETLYELGTSTRGPTTGELAQAYRRIRKAVDSDEIERLRHWSHRHALPARAR
jgi:hypothetical protein